ncbi:MAG: hypothetical protein HC803_00610 [Saprospiraceae bacterium]|nr:hypothetical protein [Saprospiraceae bacterium]
MNKIKFLSIISFCMMTSFLYAQTNDTILANQYYQQAYTFFSEMILQSESLI